MNFYKPDDNFTYRYCIPEDTVSENSVQNTRVKFNKVVQVVEYSCPTNTSKEDSGSSIISQNSSDSSDILQLDPPKNSQSQLGFDYEVPAEKNILGNPSSQTGSTMMQRILMAK